MRGSSALSASEAAIELVPADDSRPLDFANVFGRQAPLEIDLGCGDGSFLSELASQNPERDFIGIERLFGRVRGACKRITRLELTNARILRMEIPDALQHLIAPGSVDVFHLMFPDPWPKRRHHCRRVFTAEFLALVARGLVDGGTFRIATDDQDYFDAMEGVLRDSRDFAITPEPEIAAFPASTFEKRFRESGLKIHRVVLRKVSVRK